MKATGRAPYQPKVSIVINTDGRCKPLATCLESLRYLRYPHFEVVVVAGPTRDGTHELCESWGDAIKFGRCPVRNLSISRNIGIAMAAGDIVAYIDDDAVPEPEWLDDVVPAFADDEVGVAGGFLHDHTGKTYQWTYGTVNRLGSANTTWTRPTPEFNFPFSFNFPHVIGANSIFRRSALMHVGGFDEEFEYFLDETDVTARILDQGWTVAQLSKAFVHHKFMPSEIRNHAKVLTSWYSVIKNKTYFALVSGSGVPLDEVLAEVQRTIMEFRWSAQWAAGEKILTEKDLDRFEDEAKRGLHDGLARGLSGQRRFPSREYMDALHQPFRPFRATLPAAQQRCYVLLTRSYPPDKVGGVGRYIHQLARTLAQRGHQVHVLTGGAGHDRVDFEECIWVHRIVPKKHRAPETQALQGVPEHIWNHSRTMLDEAREIASRRNVDAVYGPIWDVEGIAFVDDAGFPLVTSLQTTLRFYLDSNPHLRQDAAFMRDFAEPMLRMERLLLEKSDGIHAISEAITEEIESAYGVHFEPHRLWTVPLGLEDWTAKLSQPHVTRASQDETRICFVGRLESRKGVDVVMKIAPALLREHPGVRLEFVGNDKITADDGRTWRARFEAQPEFASIRDRVDFRGELSDEGLREAYRSADIVLAPSRFESFGLVHLEAGMYGKPVVGCRIGGMVEVVEDGVTGILAEPGDAESLLQSLRRLVQDPALRERIGQAARRRYVERFTPERMTDGVVAIFTELSQRRIATAAAATEADSLASLSPAAPVSTAPPATRALATTVPGRVPDAGLPAEAITLRIVVIGSVLAPFDAISNDLVRKVGFLRQTPGWKVSVIAGHNARNDIDAVIVPRVSDVLIAPEFLQADVIIYHFGIYYPLFDAILLGNGRAKQAVVFHNITPIELGPPSARKTLERSFAQLGNVHSADVIWPDSRENAEVLLANGVERGKLTIQPLAVDRPQRQSIRKPRGDAIEIVFVGRIVPSKGVHDLVEAMALLKSEGPRVRLRVIGNLEGAEPAFRAKLLARIAELQLGSNLGDNLGDRQRKTIEFVGMVSDSERDRILGESHVLAMPSYHEGFCVPVIEALRAGMVPVVYSAHNLRYIAEGLCVSAPPGDVPAFNAALQSAIDDVDAVLAQAGDARLRLERGTLGVTEFERSVALHLDQFEPEVRAQALREQVRALAASA